MKLKVAAILVLLVVISLGIYSPVTGQSKSLSKGQLDHCENIAGWAETIMKKRQSGVSLSKALATPMPGQDNDNLHEAMVLEAYKHPHYNTPEYQQRSVGNFRNKVHLYCLEAHKKK
jgi:hypothetical protein